MQEVAHRGYYYPPTPQEKLENLWQCVLRKDQKKFGILLEKERNHSDERLRLPLDDLVGLLIRLLRDENSVFSLPNSSGVERILLVQFFNHIFDYAGVNITEMMMMSGGAGVNLEIALIFQTKHSDYWIVFLNELVLRLSRDPDWNGQINNFPDFGDLLIKLARNKRYFSLWSALQETYSLHEKAGGAVLTKQSSASQQSAEKYFNLGTAFSSRERKNTFIRCLVHSVLASKPKFKHRLLQGMEYFLLFGFDCGSYIKSNGDSFIESFLGISQKYATPKQEGEFKMLKKLEATLSNFLGTKEKEEQGEITRNVNDSLRRLAGSSSSSTSSAASREREGRDVNRVSRKRSHVVSKAQDQASSSRSNSSEERFTSRPRDPRLAHHAAEEKKAAKRQRTQDESSVKVTYAPDDLEKKVQRLQQELSDMKKDAEDAKIKLAAAQRSSRKEKERLDKQTRSLSLELTQAKAKISELQVRVTKKEDHIEELASDLNNSSATVLVHEVRVASFEKENELLIKENGQLKKENESLTKELWEERDKIRKMIVDIEQLKAQGAHQQTTATYPEHHAVTRLEQKITTFAATIAALEEEKLVLEEALQDETEKYEKEAVENVGLRKKLDESGESFGEAITTDNDQKRQIRSLKAEVKRLNRTVSNVAEERNDLQLKVANLQSLIDGHEQETKILIKERDRSRRASLVVASKREQQIAEKEAELAKQGEELDRQSAELLIQAVDLEQGFTALLQQKEKFKRRSTAVPSSSASLLASTGILPPPSTTTTQLNAMRDDESEKFAQRF